MKLSLMLVVVSSVLLSSCQLFTPKNALTAADVLCRAFFAEKQGVSVEEAAQAFCQTEEQLKPFLDQVLKSKAALSRDPRVKLQLKRKP